MKDEGGMMYKKRFLSILLILALFITTFGAIGTDEVFAASKSKKAKKIALTATPVSENAIAIKWNKIKKPYKGYAVFRDGVPIAHLGKKATSYTDIGVVAGSTHSYQVKTYTVKKVKKNKKKVKKYTYKKKSNVATASTPFPVTVNDSAFDSNPGSNNPDDLAPYINVEQGTYDIFVGETVVVTARTNHGGHTGATVRNGSCIQILSRNISYENGEHVERVSIKGLKAGTAVIEFSNNYSGTITNPVTVNVRDNSPATTPVETLYGAIDSNGYVNGNGDKTVSYSISDEYTAFFVNHTDSVELIFVQQSDSANTYSTMTIPLASASTLDAEVRIGSLAYHSSIKPSTYTKNTSLQFLDSNGDAPVEAAQNLLNSTFKLAMSGWNMALLHNYGVQMTDLGFVNY